MKQSTTLSKAWRGYICYLQGLPWALTGFPFNLPDKKDNDDDDDDEDDDDDDVYPRAATYTIWSEAEIAKLLDMPSPPPSPLYLWSSPLPQIPSPLPQILSPPLLVSFLPLPTSPTYPLGYRAAMIRLRAETQSTSHPLPIKYTTIRETTTPTYTFTYSITAFAFTLY
ncbi:hypothetical protein Tco_1337247 [Tanacetum coccineum]